MMNNLITWQDQSGQPIQVNQSTLTPQSQLLHISLPWGGFVWHRPTGVLVEKDGRTETLPITDITRLALWAFVGLVILVNMRVLLKSLRSNR